eukprot:TRINITY_DN2944_c0_g1_i3.p1 TRINITY_DN2944_c0_g1~~TRINITY_DN2944_c0_g1_i3.p1  ORF type:complete len:228 (-),score=30.02 TRINITY_DN2944_c0_g1_i3:372-1055(-)
MCAPATCINCSSVAVAGCKTCGDMCDACLKSIHGQPMFKGHTVGAVIGPRNTKSSICSKHNRDLDLYCRVDSQAVCLLCVHGPEHKGHECVVLADFVDTSLQDIGKQVGRLQGQASAVRAAAAEIRSVLEAVNQRDEQFRKALHAAVVELHQALYKREQALVTASCTIAAGKAVRARTARACTNRDIWAAHQSADRCRADGVGRVRHCGGQRTTIEARCSNCWCSSA